MSKVCPVSGEVSCGHRGCQAPNAVRKQTRCCAEREDAESFRGCHALHQWNAVQCIGASSIATDLLGLITRSPPRSRLELSAEHADDNDVAEFPRRAMGLIDDEQNNLQGWQ